MKNWDYIELVLARFVSVRATGRLGIGAAVVLIVWMSALAFAYYVIMP